MRASPVTRRCEPPVAAGLATGRSLSDLGLSAKWGGEGGSRCTFWRPAPDWDSCCVSRTGGRSLLPLSLTRSTGPPRSRRLYSEGSRRSVADLEGVADRNGHELIAGHRLTGHELEGNRQCHRLLADWRGCDVPGATRGRAPCSKVDTVGTVARDLKVTWARILPRSREHGPAPDPRRGAVARPRTREWAATATRDGNESGAGRSPGGRGALSSSPIPPSIGGGVRGLHRNVHHDTRQRVRSG
jgi:hypothetical protein